AGARVELLREQAEVVAGRGGPVEDGPGFVVTSLARETLRQPEGARQEDALASAEAVPSSVPAEEAALVELLADPIDRSDHPFVQIVDEPDRRQQQQRGIHRLRSEGLDEDAAPRVVALRLHGAADLTSHLRPPADRRPAKA